LTPLFSQELLFKGSSSLLVKIKENIAALILSKIFIKSKKYFHEIIGKNSNYRKKLDFKKTPIYMNFYDLKSNSIIKIL